MDTIKKIEMKKKKIKLKKTIIFLSLISLLLITFFISMNSGYIKLNFNQVINTIMGQGNKKENLILFSFRLPRIVLSILVGSSLALAGLIIQNISKNPLAEPGILGINSGAGLSVLIYVLVFGTKSFWSIFTLPVLAIIGSYSTAIIVYILSYKKDENISGIRLIMTGIGIQALIVSFTTLLVVKLDDTQFDFVSAWQAGSIWGSNWTFVLTLLPWVIILFPILYKKSNILDTLSLGDDISISLGLDIDKERRNLLFIAVALSASAVAVSGNIAFIGLIAPHFAKKLVGPKNNILIPTSAALGSLLLLVSDTIGRIIFLPREIPTGIMVAIIGAPYFLYLLKKNKKGI